MADKSIFDLTLQSTFGVNDRLVVGNYANNDAEAILGQTLISLLTTALDGHGGIQSIAKTSSSGTNPVVDTYTITYADASTSTFTITNGLKGDTGAQPYVYLRWAHECTGTPPVPSSWSSTTSEPDDWIGIGTGTSSSPPTNVNSYKWYKYKGETGATGIAAAITTQTVRYQASTSGTTVPSGTWSSTIPSVAQGSYLWTRTVLNFNDGTTVTSYSVGRMGIDGSGAVSTVNNVGVDSGTTNITLTGGDIALNSTNPANVAVVTDANGKFAPANISATELNMLSGASGNIQNQITANLMYMRSVTVATSGWTAGTLTSASGTAYTYYYEVSVTNMTANDFVDISNMGSASSYEGNYAVESLSGKFRIWVASEPTASTTWYVYYKVGMTATT
ncbi:MAG: hypothetical protein IIW75_08645 [Bacteroidaceae bacterium]|nr:hypothetical protein [Bacteroidaceae bacterium]